MRLGWAIMCPVAPFQNRICFMHFVIKLFPEIIVKSAPVRKRFTRQLYNNLNILIKRLSPELKVRRDWEKLEVVGPDDSALQARVAQVLANTPV